MILPSTLPMNRLDFIKSRREHLFANELDDRAFLSRNAFDPDQALCKFKQLFAHLWRNQIEAFMHVPFYIKYSTLIIIFKMGCRAGTRIFLKSEGSLF